ncbi:glycosyltransferase [Mesorhizobium humile]|uniref:Glycosyltransferase n=1 Tax=Mesorhizobium humile TaxID=3072313 RepID=A0ABU4YDI6_9HYPH|nr:MULTISPECIES: glycosyltransferase [unclassified Mesorhizobium]MDX8459207.1 glycosyltransferase [Mesorhizobium sp. VK2D]MDX8484990.1 glycosyltransferase [Mesorhizobium sp. VK2B]
MNENPSPEQLRDASAQPADQAAPKKRAKAKPAKRTCIMVLGMHRSGTSALTRAISLLGAALPKNMLGANPTNPAGHWEPLRLIDLHEQMLAEAGSRWDDWRPFEQTDLGAARLRFYKAEIAKLIDEEYGSAPLFVLKEPRISRFVPLYAEILKQLDIDVCYVLTQRNPLAVIASLEKRDGFTSGFSALLWLRHELEAERATRGKPRVFVSYEAMLEDWRVGIDKVTKALQVAWPQPSGEAISTHFSSDHQHHSASAELLYADPRIVDWIKQAYSALKDLEADPFDAMAMAQLDTIRTSFDSFTPVFGEAFFQEIEARASISERANSQLQSLADERAAEIDRQAADLTALHQEMGEKNAQLTQQQVALQHLVDEHAADTHRRTADVEKLQAKVARKDAELAQQRDAVRRLTDELSAKAEMPTDTKEKEFAARTAELQMEVERERHRASEAEDRLRRLTQELDTLRVGHTNMLMERDEILADHRVRLEAIQDSTSWRITSPLRSIGRFAKHTSFGIGYPLSVLWKVATKRSLAPIREVRAAGIIRKSGTFDREWYLKNNPDVAGWRIDPLRHYVVFGAREGRDPNPWFSSNNYLRDNPDAARTGLNPLAHFITHSKGGLANRRSGAHGGTEALADPPAKQTPPVAHTAMILDDLPGSIYTIYRSLPLPLTVRRQISWLVSKHAPSLLRLVHWKAAAHSARRAATAAAELAVVLSKREENDASDPRFSVVIPIYDRTWELREAIGSILSQDNKSFELILVLDGSPSETVEVVNEFKNDHRVRIFSYPMPSGNAVRGRNKGILEARGEYVAFLDSDDVAINNRLSLTEAAFAETGADVVYGGWQAIVDGSRTVEGLEDGQVVFSPPCDLEMLKRVCVPCQSTVAVRREAFSASGVLKPQMEYREDHELWARMAYFGHEFVALPQVLSKLRIHAGNNELAFKANDEYWLERFEQEFQVRAPIFKKIVFVLPGVGIGGGTAVVFKHAMMLLAFGHDVTIINIGEHSDASWYPGLTVPVYKASMVDGYILRNIDALFATGWQTVDFVEQLPASRKMYFVQSDERRFVDDETTRKRIADGYHLPFEFLTEAHWIRRFLKEEFGKSAAYVPNGLDQTIFHSKGRATSARRSRKRVLLEGPINVPFKGMADAYSAIHDLDCEIWVVSSAGQPPQDWRVDRFFEGVEFGKMGEIYSSCDVFLKMSRIEGFFGPPMEAMACGCAVVVGKVTGYDEYIVDGRNALVVDTGDVAAAKDAVRRLLMDEELRAKLIDGGRKTVREWTWERSFTAMNNVISDSGK